MGDPEVEDLLAFAERDVADEHEMEWLLRRFGGPEFAKPKEEQKGKPRKGFDPNQPRAADGKWNPGGGSGGKKDKPKTKPQPKAKEDKPMSPAKRKAELVKAILKALDDVLDQLTSKQAKALIERIKDNADAFIDGQRRSTSPGGGDTGGGGKKGGGGSSDAKEGKSGGGGASGPDDKGGGGSKGPGGLEGVIAGVKSLIENFGKNMKPKDRKALSDAVSKLDSMAADTATFAPDDNFDETVCIMAIPAADDPVHGIGPEDKHATLLYFGDRSKSADPERIEGSRGLFMNVLTIAAEEQEPFTAKVKGVEALGDEGAQVWMLDSPELQRLFGEIPEIDSEIHSMYEDADATRYPEYLPHVTIGYTPPAEDMPGNYDPDEYVTDETLDEAKAVKEIRFDRLSLWWGNDHYDIPLGVAEFDALIAHFGGSSE
jgi:hypothetical protein